MPGIYSNEATWFDSSKKYRNADDRSIYENHRRQIVTEHSKTTKAERGGAVGYRGSPLTNLRNNSRAESRTTSRLNARSRSHTDLHTINGYGQRPSSRAMAPPGYRNSGNMAPLVRVDPQLRDAEKAGTDYHITVNLPANLLGQVNNGFYEENVQERIEVERTIGDDDVASQTGSLDESVFATLRLNGPPLKSVVKIETNEPLRIITRQVQQQQQQQAVTLPPPAPPKPAIINKVVATATVNVRNEARTARFPVNIDSNVQARGGFFVKSIVASPVAPQVGFEIQLSGGEVKQTVETKTIPRPMPPPVSPPQKRIEERMVRRIIHEQPVIVERQRRVRKEIQEPPKREKKIRVKKVKKVAKEQVREPVREPVREQVQEVRRAMQPLPDIVEKKIEIKKETTVEIPIFEVQKAIPIKIPEKKEEEYVKEIKINTKYESEEVQQQQPIYEELDEVDDANISSQIFIERLMRGAPPDSLFQKVNVEREEEVIVGPLTQYEVEQMYAQSMINVDTVSEKVDLTVSNGVAHLIVKVRNEKIVPIRGSNDCFKKSAVVVTRLIDVDLNVTRDRRIIMQEIMENQTRGRLNNRYTFELYKAFLALADADSGYSGQVPQQMVIEKTVEDHNLWDLRRQGKLSTSEDQADARFVNEEESERNLRDLLVSNRVFNNDLNWDRSDSWTATPRYETNNHNVNANYPSHAHNTTWSANKYPSRDTVFQNNQLIFDRREAPGIAEAEQMSSFHRTKWQSDGGFASGAGRAGGLSNYGGGAGRFSGAGGFSGASGYSVFDGASSASHLGGAGNVIMPSSTPWMANINVPVAAKSYTATRSFGPALTNNYLDVRLESGRRILGGGGGSFANNRWSGGNDSLGGYQGDASSRQVLSELNSSKLLDASRNLEDHYNSGYQTSTYMKSSTPDYLVLEEEPIDRGLSVRHFRVRNAGDYGADDEGHAQQGAGAMYESLRKENYKAPVYTSTTEISKTNYSNAYVPRNHV